MVEQEPKYRRASIYQQLDDAACALFWRNPSVCLDHWDCRTRVDRSCSTAEYLGGGRRVEVDCGADEFQARRTLCAEPVLARGKNHLFFEIRKSFKGKQVFTSSIA